MTAEFMDVSNLAPSVVGLRPVFREVDGTRQIRVNKERNTVVLAGPNGLAVNSMLREDEWAEVDRAVLEAAKYPLKCVADLRSRGLVQRLGGIGTLVSQWYTGSEMTSATVNMSGQGGGSRDLQDLKQVGVPVPVVFKEFAIGARELETSRRLGDGLDMTNAVEASRVVAESLESMLMNGSTAVLNGQAIYGYRTHTNRNTDTATNYGGGDWGTIANVLGTVGGMISAANVDNHFGPFMLYVSQTQYNQAALQYYTDGSGQTPVDRILRIPSIVGVQGLSTSILADGEVVLVQMTRDVVDWAEALDIQVREWTTNDGMASIFKVLAIATPRVKARYDGKSGIVHATGA
jgi:uncharacterized linocin/CFP29 family protein